MTMTTRTQSYLQDGRGTVVDRFGVWLSARQIRRAVPTFAGKRVGDFGCGFQASFSRTIVGDVAGLTLVDVALADDLKADPRIRAIEGQLPGALAGLPAASLDVVMIVSVLEHVSDPAGLLREVRRLLAPGGVALVNVPSWRGKRYLELATFRLHLGAACEVDDHKMYYDVRDLWPMLVAAGFRPSQIDCFSHKFGLNTFAVCKAEP
jgi:2-polyprenyl-3-methyl-5-hydroxy-6-metoxy-1,4-benzoquinol methylase